MTSVCVGGVASQLKAGKPSRIYLDTEFVASILPLPLAWLVPFLPYLPPIFVDLTAFCAGEPPSPPNLVEATMSAVLAGGEFGAAVVAAELIQAVILNQFWYLACECTSGTQPTAPTPQAEPSGIVRINPPSVVTGPTAGACGSFSGSGTPIHAGAQIALVGSGAQGSVSGSILIPAGTTSVRVTLTRTNSDTFVTECHGEFFNTAGTFSGTTPNIDQSTNTTTVQFANVTGQNTFKYMAAQLTGATQTTAVVSVVVDFFCGGQNPGQVVSPCCPPDPIMTGMLTQILNYVTLIQRQAVPFGYVLGTAHTALSGAGALSISGLLGVKVSVTTLPSSYGVAGTSPPEHFDLGFVTFGTPDGFPSAFRLTRNPQTMMPARCSVYTDLDYDLAPGVVVTITELRREP